LRIARRFGFAGRVEYRHVSSVAGGAQYGRGESPADDLLVVYADAFDRDADPDDFSLEAIVAHERGHQILCRDIRIDRLVIGSISVATEEVLASLIGSVISDNAADRESLVFKALNELVERGMPARDANRLVRQLRDYLERYL
jgi:hypothetical protein